MKTTKNPHLERNQHPLSKLVWSNESIVINTLLIAANCSLLHLFRSEESFILFYQSKLVVTLREEFLSFVKTSTNFFVIPFLDMTPEYEREKQPSRDVRQTGFTM